MPATTRYTKDHEWVRLDGDIATIGITAYVSQLLGAGDRKGGMEWKTCCPSSSSG